MKKRIGLLFALLLTVTAAVCLLTFSASAATYSGTCGKNGSNLTWSLNTSTGLLTIDGEGDMADYSYVYRDSANHTTAPWGTYDSYVKSVTIGNGVTNIGRYAFDYCSGLTSVNIPDSVTTIGEYAFSSCSSLTSITVSSGNESYCSIDGVLFRKDQKSLLCYPAGKYGSYTIPDSVTSIGENAFASCSSLTSVTIPDSVTSIGNNAFYGCSGLTSITIGNGVTSIGGDAFRGCSSLTNITVSSGNESYCSIDGVLFRKDQKSLLCYPAGKRGSYTIPDSVTSIGGGAFWGCSNLTSITIGNGVTSIGSSAFYECSSLFVVRNNSRLSFTRGNTEYGYVAYNAKVIITKNSSGTEVYNWATGWGVDGDWLIETSTSAPRLRAYLGQREEVTLPLTNRAGKAYAYYQLRGVRRVIVPDGVTSIGSYAFYGCSGLTSVTIPESVTHIGENAFKECGSEETIVHYTGTAAQWETITVDYGKYYLSLFARHYMTEGRPVAATCTADGYTGWVCPDCSYTYSTVTEKALGHTPGDAATCTTDQLCTRCHTVLTEKLGHVPGEAATCTTDQLCTRCLTVLTEKLGHTPGEAATCTTAQTCIRCDYVFAEKLGHVPGEAATCTTDQLCTRCLTVLTEKLGHTPGAAATCLTDQICTRCHDVLTEAFGHTYENDLCVRCGAHEYLLYEKADTSVTVTGMTGDRDTVVIPATIEGLPVTAIGDGAFDGRSGLTAITLPVSLMTVGDAAFTGCRALYDVYYGGTLNDRDGIAIGSGNNPLKNAAWHCVGDFDEDEETTNADITLLIRYLAGWTDVALDEASADVNHDGKVNNRDAIALIRIVAKWED